VHILFSLAYAHNLNKIKILTCEFAHELHIDAGYLRRWLLRHGNERHYQHEKFIGTKQTK